MLKLPFLPLPSEYEPFSSVEVEGNIPRIEIPSKSNDTTSSWKYDQLVGALNSNLLLLTLLSSAAIYKYFVQPRVSKWKYSLSKTLKLQRNIEGILYQILAHYEADRVILACPHNGSVFTNKVHMWKISAWLEVMSPGVSQTRDELQSIPLSKIEDYLEQLEKDVFIHSCSIDTVPGDFLTDYYTRNGVDSCIHILLKCGESIDGIICIHNPKKVEEAARYTREISSLLRSSGNSLVTKLLSKIGG